MKASLYDPRRPAAPAVSAAPAMKMAAGLHKVGAETRHITEGKDVQLKMQWTITNNSNNSCSLDAGIMQEATDAFFAVVMEKQQEGVLSKGVIGVKREANEDDTAVAGPSSTFFTYRSGSETNKRGRAPSAQQRHKS